MCSLYLFKGILGCIGAFCLHLIIGSIYQWGIINVYITSYYSLIQGPQTLTTNAIVFPLMMLSAGFTMKLGNDLSSKIGTPIMTGTLSIILAALTFASSYAQTFIVFVILYGIIFGLMAGLIFTSVMVENNKYFVDKQAYVNGFILIGTGLGSAIFGIFSYNYLNPQKLKPQNGLYITPELAEIAERVPECIRYLSLFYLCIGVFGSSLMIPVYIYNRKQNQQVNRVQNNSNPQSPPNNADESIQSIQQKIQINGHSPVPSSQTIQNKHLPTPPVQLLECPDMKTAFCHKITYFTCVVYFLTSIGNLFVNNNFKTYVSQYINDDEFLTYIGAIASTANGFSRFIFNMLYRKIGIKWMTTLFGIVNAIVYGTVKLTVYTPAAYYVLIIISNIMLGAFLAMAPTQCIKTYGRLVGGGIYGFYWIIISLANLTAYGVGRRIDLNIAFLIFLGMSLCSVVLCWFIKFDDINWNEKVQPEGKEVEMHAIPIQIRKS